MYHLTVESVRAEQAMRMEGAAERRLAADLRPEKRRRRLSAVLARVRRAERHVPATVTS
jgi:hypothetical protein